MPRTVRVLLVACTVAVVGTLGGVASAQETTTTGAPTTEAPTTAPPTTAAPATTAAATTAPPDTTAAPDTTGAPATISGAPTDEDNDSDTWLLILIAVVVVGGIIAWFVGRSRAQQAKSDWHRQATALLDELSDVGINLAAAQPSALPVIAPRIESRLVALNGQLASVHQRGPSAVERNALVPVINAANTLHAALTQVLLAPPGTQSPAAANLTGDAALVDSTARAAKLSLLGVAPTTP
jgi:hypothetical protein